MLTWLPLVMSLWRLFMLSFFPRDVLDEIWDLIDSVSEGFPFYSYLLNNSKSELILYYIIALLNKFRVNFHFTDK